MGSNSYYSNMNIPSEVNSVDFGNYFENGGNPLEDDFTESWKSTLNFTGSNPVYPLEMFISIMEHKYKIQSSSKDITSEEDSKFGSTILSHISDDELTPAGLWKKQFLPDTVSASASINSSWSAIKRDLIKHFGHPNLFNNKSANKGGGYSMQERILMFYSLMRNPDENLGIYRVRVSLVANILEHGNINKQASQDWVRLLFLLGLNEEDRNLIVDEANFIYDINGLCSLLLERQLGLNIDDDTNDIKESIDTDKISDVLENNVIPESSSSIKPVSLVRNKNTEVENVNERLISSVPEIRESSEINHVTSSDKERVDALDNSRLVVEWENDESEGIKGTKKRKKGTKLKRKVPKQESPSPRKSLGGRSICVICNKDFESVAEFKKHNLEVHPADKPTKVIFISYKCLNTSLFFFNKILIDNWVMYVILVGVCISFNKNCILVYIELGKCIWIPIIPYK